MLRSFYSPQQLCKSASLPTENRHRRSCPPVSVFLYRYPPLLGRQANALFTVEQRLAVRHDSPHIRRAPAPPRPRIKSASFQRPDLVTGLHAAFLFLCALPFLPRPFRRIVPYYRLLWRLYRIILDSILCCGYAVCKQKGAGALWWTAT